MHPPGNGGFGDAEDLRGLGMGELLAGDEHRRVAQGRFEAGNGALQPDGVIGVTAVLMGGKSDQHGELFGEGAERTAAAAPVAAGVEGDAVEPGGELGVAAVAADLLDQGAADVLGDVVGVGARAGQLPGEAVDAVVMAVEEFGECVAIAGDCGGDETVICVAADCCRLPRCGARLAGDGAGRKREGD